MHRMFYLHQKMFFRRALYAGKNKTRTDGHGTLNMKETRFNFGENWKKFLSDITPERIRLAEESLKKMLDKRDLSGMRFLDIGSGSGLFSLAARRLGADVVSFDYDESSVRCSRELKEQSGLDRWDIMHGDALDRKLMERLGMFDIVYSWGVLHHTGNMLQAMENAATAVKPDGKLFIALYNDQGRKSRHWRMVKKLYNSLSAPARPLLLFPVAVRIWALTLIKDLLTGHPLKTWNTYSANRGMSPWRDIVDWVGGYPFETAKPDFVFDFYKKRGFSLEAMTVSDGYGCNEYVFSRKHC